MVDGAVVLPFTQYVYWMGQKVTIILAYARVIRIALTFATLPVAQSV